jgi:hypothetical protein
MKIASVFFLSVLVVLLMFSCVSCAQQSPNDGLVPRMSAQANLSYTPVVTNSGTLMAAPSGGSTISPLNETRKAYWSTP